MKKALLLVAASSLALPALAQTERGTVLLGASIGDLSYAREQAGRYLSAELHPTAGYFLADHFALGSILNLGYSRNWARRDGRSELYLRGVSYGFSPFARYYFLNADRHHLFAEAGGDLNWTRYRGLAVDIPGRDGRATAAQRGYHAALGYTYSLTPTAALEASAGYYRFTTDDYQQRRSAVDVRLGFTAFLPSAGRAK